MDPMVGSADTLQDEELESTLRLNPAVKLLGFYEEL